MSDGSSSQVKIALIQHRACPSKQATFDRLASLVAEAADRGGQLICLPELFATYYPCQTEDHGQFALAETVDGPTTHFLQDLARQHRVALVGSIFERRDAGLYHNTAVIVDNSGALVGVYRKTHIPDDPRYYEKFYFAPGDLGYPVFDLGFCRLAVGVCWDQWFPEVARLFALAGAQILIFPTAIGWHPEEKALFGALQHEAWELMHRSHAIANGMFVAAVNRTGSEGSLQFWGSSLVCDPNGVVLARAPHDQEMVLLADCELEKIDVVRTHWPFLRDRRIDTYHGLLQRHLKP